MSNKILKMILIVALVMVLLIPTFNLATEPTENTTTTIENTIDSGEENTVEPEEPVSTKFIFSWDDSKVVNGKFVIEDGPGITCIKNDSTGGQYEIEAKTKVTIKCIPNYGYNFNGNFVNQEQSKRTQFVPVDSQECTYTFTMPECDLSIAEDSFISLSQVQSIAVSGSPKLISGLNISDLGNENIQSGTVSIKWKEVTPESDVISKIAGVAGSGFSVFDYVDIEITNNIKKGSRDKYWEKSITSLSNPVTVTIILGAKMKGQEPYKVIRYHNGTAEEIGAEYDDGAGTLTFSTDKFSYYAIAGIQKEETNNPSSSSSTSSQTSTTNTVKNTTTNTATNAISNNVISNSTNNTTTNSATPTANNNPKTGDAIDSYVTAFIISIIIMTAIVFSYKMDYGE